MSTPSSPTSRVGACYRLLRAVGHIVAGLLTIIFKFPRMSADQREMRIQAWSRQLLAILQVQLVVQGQPVRSGPALLVANHISWLDIVVLHASRHCRFVSKSDVQRWPLIGRMATAAGTLYIERSSRRDALRVVHHMTEALRAGDVLAVFPEGTTGDGTTVLPFHANLLQAAISAAAPVQPVTLRFEERLSGERSLAPIYVGDDTLLASLWRTLTAPPLSAVVHFGDVQTSEGQDRRQWATELREAIVRQAGAAD